MGGICSPGGIVECAHGAGCGCTECAGECGVGTEEVEEGAEGVVEGLGAVRWGFEG